MVLALMALTVTIPQPDLNQVIYRLRAWEARFERARVECTFPDGTTWVCENWPGHFVLHRTRKNSSKTTYFEYGRVWESSIQNGERLPIYTLYGTELREQVRIYRDECLQPLFYLGARIGASEPLSEAVSKGSKHRLHRLGNGATRITFQSAGAERGTVEVTIAPGRAQPSSVRELPPQGGFIAYELALAHPDPRRWNPITIIQKYKVGSGPVVSRSLVVTRVTPLRKEPRLFQPRPGLPVIDEATGMRTVTGGVVPLDVRMAARTIGAARTGKATEGSKLEPTQPSCGPDALYYLVALHGRTLEIESLLESFGPIDGGVSLEKVRSVAQAFEFRPKAVFVKDGNLDRLRLPCILSLRPSHFVVAVSINRRTVLLIDPRYAVREMPRELIEGRWTGYSLSLEGVK